VISALPWSRPTSTPSKPPRVVVLLIFSISSGVSASGCTVFSINCWLRKPSGVISVTQALDVHSDCTPSRSTFGRDMIACVTS
jgi:cytochrome bd-type quinol oxidase subunit 1